MKEDFGDKPFSFSNYLNILSAHQVNPDYEIELLYKYEPQSNYFKKLNSFCKLTQINNIPQTLNNKPVDRVEHICGYLRIKKLYEEGGIYLDTDVICVKSFNDLLNGECILGTEWQSPKAEKACGTSDAIILAQKNSSFLKKWIDDYHFCYENKWYAYNGCARPFDLSKEFPDEVNILPVESFCKYSWYKDGFHDLFEKDSSLENAYTLHLFSSINSKHLELYDNLNNEVWKRSCTVTNIYKQILKNNK